MTKLQLNSQQTVKPQKQIQAPPMVLLGLAVGTQGGNISHIRGRKNVR